ncbi:DNA-binding NtrC family response regulator [Dysgonomonas sp. PFB1-18]|uniref:sigma-54-dependent transcriptional regulator n=1 Tax=unclassified Dysgonomonas TaxID=2630389 RepID=UPI002473E91F|nr:MULTISPECIES: sigma-54 dependent transcriptional regulator [unclassified Dysgonomonas]MDH6309513.1 DNA-binding NtrC family response regulator [Dysgonomonas sp. PF1-14]MDH6339159.1 DNA-binding NtrC family response regulator [Dysgonomonas sp. PF1-16]MDH6380555.1 DNA-binding NtrC family response regulator [Dysgonomonas sp. PFB1-18]MDH6398051.1 DNA-binding NtrC family response regulator [Dysgonomonas sp. PF1-23]
MKKGSILIVDDNKNVLSALRILLNNYFEEVHLLSSPNMLVSMLREKSPDIVLLDMNYSAGINTGNEGLYWLSEVKKIDAELPVVLFTAYADIELAVKALKEGASDFVVKPWDNAKLLATLQSALALRQSRKEVQKLKEKQNILNSELNKENDVCWGKSEVMQNLLSIIEKVARTDANVLITGENGTGKEVIARKIHSMSLRSSETLVSVDMGAITETLFESELFGHVKGAFTDARADRAGKFEAADKGTLFLDEIGNLSYTLQAKLLTALQSRQIVRVGSNKPIPVDIRLISATNRNLFESVNNNEFREDLLYRINTIQIEVPPLRNRKEDVSLLAGFFLRQFSRKYNKPGLYLSDDTIAKLESYSWPGNVRELQHAIEKAVILSDGTELRPSDFYMRDTGDQQVMIESITLDEMEKILIEKALKRYDGNISAIASELGITRPTLYNKMKKYGLS